MATLTIQNIGLGTAVTRASAAAAGDEFLNDGNVWITLKNTNGAAARTVTIISQKVVDGVLAVADLPILLSANEEDLVRPLDRGIYNDTAGKVQLTYSDSGADIQVGVFKSAA